MVVRKNCSYPLYSRSVRCSSRRNFLRRSGTVLLEPLCFVLRAEAMTARCQDRVHIAEMVAIKDPRPAKSPERATRMAHALWNEDSRWCPSLLILYPSLPLKGHPDFYSALYQELDKE